jgi:hypothetical protein
VLEELTKRYSSLQGPQLFNFLRTQIKHYQGLQKQVKTLQFDLACLQIFYESESSRHRTAEAYCSMVLHDITRLKVQLNAKEKKNDANLSASDQRLLS